MENIKLALIGFGNAGKAFAELLIEKNDEITSTFGKKVLVVAISTKTKGTLINENGINLSKALGNLEKNGKFQDGKEISSMDTVKKCEYDILIELTPLNMFTGQPAIDHIKGALSRGKHVITANKGPIARAYVELMEIAKSNNAKLFCETTVMDGAPVFNLVDFTLPFCKVTKIEGILNTTTNFILEEMEKGISLGEAIKEGKTRGFVEADPSADIEGWDSSSKLSALMNVLMGARMTPEDVKRKGIEDVTYEQIKDAQNRGKMIKLMCRGEIVNGTIEAFVKPTEVEKGSLYATVDGTSSAVSITTDLMGTITITEHNPEIQQTAYGIFSDLIRALKFIGGTETI